MTIQPTMSDRAGKQRGEPTEPAHTRALAEFISGLSLDAIPAEVQAHAKLDILDTLGCALFGRGLPIAATLEAAFRPGDENGAVSVWGDPSWRTSPNAGSGFQIDGAVITCGTGRQLIAPLSQSGSVPSSM